MTTAITASKTVIADIIDEHQTFLTLRIGEQLFGIPVSAIREVLRSPRVGRIPLAPPEIAGVMNLRGRIVTSVDVRCRLALPLRPAGDSATSVIVARESELYSLVVDAVGDVIKVNAASFERNPPTLDPRWRAVATGIHRLDGNLMVVLDIDRLLDFRSEIDRAHGSQDSPPLNRAA